MNSGLNCVATGNHSVLYIVFRIGYVTGCVCPWSFLAENPHVSVVKSWWNLNVWRRSAWAEVQQGAYMGIHMLKSFAQLDDMSLPALGDQAMPTATLSMPALWWLGSVALSRVRRRRGGPG